MHRWLALVARNCRGRTVPIRIRLTVIATATVACALLSAALLLVLSINSVLVHGADSVAAARASQLAAAVHEEGTSGVDAELLTQTQNVDVIQILDSHGRVVIAVPATDTAMTVAATPGGEHTVYVEEQTGDTEYRAAVRGVLGPTGEHLTVVVGAAEAPIQRAVALTALMCAIGFPFMVIGMAVLTYALTGRTLQSVRDIRRHLSEASEGGRYPLHPIEVPPSGDETSALAITMNAMLDRINETHRRQTTFVASAARDLTAPVRNIITHLSKASDAAEAIDPTTADKLLAQDAAVAKQVVTELLSLTRPNERDRRTTADRGRPPQPNRAPGTETPDTGA